MLGAILEMALSSVSSDRTRFRISNLVEDSKIIINNRTTILITPDGKKTVCRPSENEAYNKETGIAMCFVKYLFGSRRKFLQFVDKAKDQTPNYWER